MSYTITAQPFSMGTLKDKALKPLEEASEAREATQRYAQADKDREGHMAELVGAMRSSAIYECCDTLQATFNLLAGLDVSQSELTDAMDQVHAHNVERGRY